MPTSPGELPNLATLFTAPLDRAIVGEEIARRSLETQWRECQPPPGV